MKILLIFQFFHYIWFIDSENLCFILILKENMTRFLTFNIVHFPNFEISASLLLALLSNKRRTSVSKFNKRRGLLLEEIRYDINLPNFINRLCLLPKLFSEMYFLYYA